MFIPYSLICSANEFKKPKEKLVYIKPYTTDENGIKRIYIEEDDMGDKIYKVPETTGLTTVWQTIDITSNDMIYNESDTTSEERMIEYQHS